MAGKIINFRVDVATAKRLSAIAKRNRVSRSDVVRLAVELSIDGLDANKNLRDDVRRLTEEKASCDVVEAEDILESLQERLPGENWLNDYF